MKKEIRGGSVLNEDEMKKIHSKTIKTTRSKNKDKSIDQDLTDSPMKSRSTIRNRAFLRENSMNEVSKEPLKKNNTKLMITVTFLDATHTNLMMDLSNKVDDLLKKVCMKRQIEYSMHHFERVDGTIISLSSFISDISNEMHILLIPDKDNLEEITIEDEFLELDKPKKKGKSNLLEVIDFSFDSESGLIDQSLFIEDSLIKEEEDYKIDLALLEMKSIPKEIKCMRDNIAYEILTSEQSYMRGLIVLREFYCNQVIFFCEKNCWPNQIQQSFKKIEMMIESIISINMILLKNLEERLTDWESSKTVGDVILKLTPYLKVYTTYTSEYDRSIEEIAKWEQKFVPLKDKMTEIMENPNVKDFMRSFAITPVQRVPRYILLIRDLIKNTDPSHPDLQYLQECLDKMSKIAQEVNESIRNAENTSKCLSIQSLTLNLDDIIAPHRKFLKESKLKKVCKKDTQTRIVWLFSDILIYAHKISGSEKLTNKNKKYSNSQIFHLLNLESNNPIKVEENPENENIPSQDKDKAFQIISDNKSFILLASTIEEKNDWINSINLAIQSELKNKSTFHL